MLRISKKADYAVFLLGCIARQGAYPGGAHADAVVSAQEISKQAGLNKSVVANLLKEFGKHGLLESVRGLKGGYRLVRAPSEIALGEILAVVDGPFALVDCLRDGAHGGHGSARSQHDGEPCSLISFCPSKSPMRAVHERIANLFREIHLDEMCGLVPLPTSPAAVRGAATAPATARASR